MRGALGILSAHDPYLYVCEMTHHMLTKLKEYSLCVDIVIQPQEIDTSYKIEKQSASKTHH
jgi:hypothetical protein